MFRSIRLTINTPKIVLLFTFERNHESTSFNALLPNLRFFYLIVKSNEFKFIKGSGKKLGRKKLAKAGPEVASNDLFPARNCGGKNALKRQTEPLKLNIRFGS